MSRNMHNSYGVVLRDLQFCSDANKCVDEPSKLVDAPAPLKKFVDVFQAIISIPLMCYPM